MCSSLLLVDNSDVLEVAMRRCCCCCCCWGCKICSTSASIDAADRVTWPGVLDPLTEVGKCTYCCCINDATRKGSRWARSLIGCGLRFGLNVFRLRARESWFRSMDKSRFVCAKVCAVEAPTKPRESAADCGINGYWYRAGEIKFRSSAASLLRCRNIDDSSSPPEERAASIDREFMMSLLPPKAIDCCCNSKADCNLNWPSRLFQPGSPTPSSGSCDPGIFTPWAELLARRIL